MNTELGKITSLKLGRGGYQDAQFGVTVGLSMKGSGTNDFKGFRGQSVNPNGAQWSEVDRSMAFAGVMRWLDELCRDAKVSDISQLAGKPVEVKFEGNQLMSWRLLTEVL